MSSCATRSLAAEGSGFACCDYSCSHPILQELALPAWKQPPDKCFAWGQADADALVPWLSRGEAWGS